MFLDFEIAFWKFEKRTLGFQILGEEAAEREILGGSGSRGHCEEFFFIFYCRTFFYESDVASSVLLSYVSVLDLFAKEQMKFQY